MKRFNLQVCVMLTHPIESFDDGAKQVMVGYYKVYCVNTGSEQEAKEMISNIVEDGAIDWSDSTVKEEDLEYGNDHVEGITYASGSIFFPA